MGWKRSVVIPVALGCALCFAWATTASAQEDPQSLIQQALVLWGTGKNEPGLGEATLQAKALLERVVSDFPGTEEAADALRHLAYGHYFKGLKEEAMSYYDRLFREYPNSYARAQAWLDLNGFAAAEDRHEEAIKYCQNILANFSGGDQVANAKFDMARNYMALAKCAEAVEWFKQVLAQHPGTKWADESKIEIARCYAAMGDMKEALPWFERVLREHPDTPWANEARQRMAWAREREGNYSEALRLWQQALQREPAGPLAAAIQMGIARCRGFAGDVDGALALLDTLPAEPRAKDAMKDDSMQASAMFIRARVLRHAGRDADAHAAFQALRGRWPATYEAGRGALVEGQWYADSDLLAPALEAFMWVALNGQQSRDVRAEAWLHVGGIHLSWKLFDEALLAYRSAISMSPTSTWARAAAWEAERAEQGAKVSTGVVSMLSPSEAGQMMAGVPPEPPPYNYKTCDPDIRYECNPCDPPDEICCRNFYTDGYWLTSEKWTTWEVLKCRDQTPEEKQTDPDTCDNTWNENCICAQTDYYNLLGCTPEYWYDRKYWLTDCCGWVR